MATSTPEPATDYKYAEANSQGTPFVHGAPQQVIESHGELAGRVFSGRPFQPSAGEVAQLLRSHAMSHSANNLFRLAAVARAQRTSGNRFVQRLANRLQQTTIASRIQRHCACGGTCDEC